MSEKHVPNKHIDVSQFSNAQLQAMIQNLEVHQIELEMQNDELTKTKTCLEQARNEYFDLFEFAPLGYLIINEKQEILKSNYTFCKLIRIEKREVEKRIFSSLIAGDFQDVFFLKFRQFRTKEATSSVEINLITNEKIRVWVKLELTKQTNGENYLVSVTPIDELKKTIEELSMLKDTLNVQNQELKESKTLFEAITKYAQDAIILIDTDDNIKIWNKAAEKIFGYTEHEVKNKELHSIIIPDEYIESFRKGFAMFKKTGQGNAIGTTVEVVGRRKDGGRFPAEISISAITIENQLNAIGIVRDITDKKQYEIVLKEQEKQVREILEYQPIPVCLSKGTELIYMNQKFKDFFGYTLDEVPDWDGWFLRAYPDEAYRNLALKTFTNDVEQHKASPQDVPRRIYKITTKNGAEKHIEISFSILGEFVIGSFIDITQKMNDKKQLIELNATKDKFSRIIAHDLKNPFNTLLGFSELLMRNALRYSPEKIQQFAQNMHSTAKQGYKLLENLLEWSRLQTGDIQPIYVKTKPSELIYEVTLLIEQMAKSKNIDLQSNVRCDEFISADKEMIKTVLRNLITNALKFTNRGGSVIIKTKSNESNVLFIISDTGLGIEPNHLDNLFRIDNKLSKPGTANEQGTGLGLILCKEFVEKNNGKIWVESELGKGSNFQFSIPFYKNNDTLIID